MPFGCWLFHKYVSKFSISYHVPSFNLIFPCKSDSKLVYWITGRMSLEHNTSKPFIVKWLQHMYTLFFSFLLHTYIFIYIYIYIFYIHKYVIFLWWFVQLYSLFCSSVFSSPFFSFPLRISGRKEALKIFMFPPKEKRIPIRL